MFSQGCLDHYSAVIHLSPLPVRVILGLFQMHDALADGINGGFGAVLDVELAE